MRKAGKATGSMLKGFIQREVSEGRATELLRR